MSDNSTKLADAFTEYESAAQHADALASSLPYCDRNYAQEEQKVKAAKSMARHYLHQLLFTFHQVINLK